MEKKKSVLHRLNINWYPFLAENAGKVITYESIIKDIWGTSRRVRTIGFCEVNMANIRRKIEENPAVPKYVFTEVGVGYRMLENELNS